MDADSQAGPHIGLLCHRRLQKVACSWVLLLLPSIAATEGTNMSLANAIVIEEDGTEHTARFGPVGYDSDERIRVR